MHIIKSFVLAQSTSVKITQYRVIYSMVCLFSIFCISIEYQCKDYTMKSYSFSGIHIRKLLYWHRIHHIELFILWYAYSQVFCLSTEYQCIEYTIQSYLFSGLSLLYYYQHRVLVYKVHNIELFILWYAYSQVSCISIEYQCIEYTDIGLFIILYAYS